MHGRDTEQAALRRKRQHKIKEVNSVPVPEFWLSVNGSHEHLGLYNHDAPASKHGFACRQMAAVEQLSRQLG
eukprot:1159129-Pelagomonas_calceolata.AAC.14